VALGLAIPGWRAATLTVSVQNLFDDRHVEFVGAPVLGRYAVTRLRVGW
jgi:hypothetical protein